MKRTPRRRLAIQTYHLQKKSQRYLSAPVRAVLGSLLIAGGILGFLPVVGFWMIPLGLAVLATDIPPLKRWITRRVRLHRRSR